MIKKILFYGIAIVLGLMIWMTSYYGFYMSHIQGLIQGSIESKDYDKVSKAFLPFYNEEQIEVSVNTDKFAPIQVYEAMIGEKVEVTVDEQKQMANRYERAYVIYLDDITFDLDGISNDQGYINHTKIRLYNDEVYYDYFFNEPNTAKDPNEEGVKRYYVNAAKELQFVELDITEKIIKDNLNGALDGFEIFDAKGVSVAPKYTFEKELNFDTDFFKLGAELESAYDLYLEKPNDNESAKAYKEFYQKWYEKYTANENYGIAYTQRELKPMSVYLKTGGVIAGYIVIVAILGYLLLRKPKNPRYSAPKERKVQTEAPKQNFTYKDVEDAKALIENNDVIEEVKEDTTVLEEKASEDKKED